MYRLLVVCFSSVIALTDVDKKCVEDNSELLSNDLLLGSWYKIYRFAPGATFPPSIACTEVKYTKPTADVIEEYKAKYNAPDLPYSLDDNPILQNHSRWEGMVTGVHRAKFYILTPRSTARLTDGYSLTAYKPLSEKFMMTTECAMRGQFRWLLSRDRNASVKEMEEIIAKTSEFKNLDGQRFCANS